MKKRLLSALLALALVFVLLPTTALAGEVTTNGDISIAGKCWNFTKSTSGYETVYYQVQSNNGVFSTSLDNKTGCVWPTNPYLEITRTGNTITVIVHNKVTITTNKGTNNAAEECIEVNKSNNQTTTLNLVIKGAEGTTNNTLTLECKSYGSALSSYQGGITITGGVTVNAKSTYTNSSTGVSARAINVFNGDLTISGTGTTVNAENKDRNHPTIDVKNAVTISDGATLTAKNTNGGKAISCRSITADGYDFMGRSGNSGSYTTLTGDDKATKLQEYSSIQITPTPTPALEKSNVYVAGTNLYKNTAYTIQNGKPVMGGTYPGNYNIYFDATDYVLHVKDANIDARGTTGIYGTSDIVFVGVNSITASTYGIYSYFKSSDLKISGTGSLNVKTIAGDPAIATAYDTSRSIIISGNGFTVTADTSETTSYAIKSDNDLTITDGAAVIAKSNATRAIDVNGSLTVTGASLTATSKSDNVPTVQVGGNATFTGSTVTITNNSTALHKDAADATKGDSVSSALYVKGNINITDNATVTAKVENGGGNAIGAVGNITVNGSTVTAVNKGQKFTTIIAEDVYVSGDSKITANNLNENPVYNGSYLAFPAIEGNIVNQNTDYSLKFEGQHNGTSVPKTTLAPGEQTTLYYYNVTITRGDKVVRTPSPVFIAGTTLLNDTYYTITNNGSTVAEGTESNYNAFYNSTTKTLKLNNASINGTGVKAIEANVGGYTFTIELVGNNIIKTSGSANNVIDITGNLYFTGSGTAEVSGKGTPIYATYKIDVSADVTITNTEKAGSFTFSAYGENSSNYKGANTFAIGTGYTAYATTDKTTWAVYDNTTASENESYTTLRVTTQTLETGGGSTHEHVWDEAWHDTGDYHHAHQCTICKAYDTTTQEPHNVTGHRDNLDGSHSNICGSCGYSAKVSHSYTWAPNANDNEKHIGTCVCGNVVERYHNFVGDVCSDCGYDKSTGTTCEHVWTTEWTIDTVDNEYHWHKCIKCNAITDKKPHAYTIVTDSGTNHIRECECKVFYVEDHISSDWIIDTPATATTAGSMHKECTVCKHKMQTEVIPATGEIVPPTPDNPGTIVIIRPAEEEKPAQQPNPSTGANDLVGLAVAAAVAAALGSAALLRKHD